VRDFSESSRQKQPYLRLLLYFFSLIHFHGEDSAVKTTF